MRRREEERRFETERRRLERRALEREALDVMKEVWRGEYPWLSLKYGDLWCLASGAKS